MKEYLEKEDKDDDVKRLLLIADTHFSKKCVDTMADTRKIWTYGEEYGCDELVVGGDISEDVEDAANLYLEEVFDSFRVAIGNHDNWSEDMLYREVSRRTKDHGSVLAGNKIKWSSADYRISMAHKPHDFHIRAKRKKSSWEWDSEIILYGHSHSPYDRVLGKDKTLAVGIGSTFSNYDILYKNGERLRRSFQILELGEEVKIKNYDFDKDILVEEAVYRNDEEGFERIYDDYFGVPEYDDGMDLEEMFKQPVYS